MEYGPENNVFVLKMMMKSGLEKIVLKFLRCAKLFVLLHKNAQNCKFSNKNDLLCAWWDFTKKIVMYCKYNKRLNFSYMYCVLILIHF